MNRSGSRSLSRRSLVAGIGVGVGVGLLAGCLDSSNGATGEPESEQGREDLELVDHPGDEPTDPPEDYRCQVCNMKPAQYPHWNTQLTYDDGGAFFDSAGCLFNYYADQEYYGGPDAEITGVWARDFETRDMTDATEASFVLEDNHDRNDAPMDSPVPFAERDDAIAYVEEYDNLTEDDIVGLEDAASDKALIY